MKKIFIFLTEIPKNYLFLPIFVIIVLFKFFDIETDLHVSENEKLVFDIVNKIESGSKVLIIANFGPEAKYELEEALSSVITFFANKDVGIVFVTLIPTGIESVFMSIEKSVSSKDFKKEKYFYGQDFVHLGYFAGGSAGSFLLSKKIRDIHKYDVYGNDISNVSVMNGIESIDDFSAVFEFSSQTIDGTPSIVYFSSFSDYKSVNKISFCTSDMVGNYIPFLESGSISAIIGGYRSISSFTGMIAPSSQISKKYSILSAIIVYIVCLILFSGAARYFRGQK